MGLFLNPDNSGFQAALNAKIYVDKNAIVPLFNMDFDGLRTDMIAMLSGSSVEVDVSCFQNDVVNFTNKDDILTYLIHLGYLGYDQNKKAAFIPNEEIRQELNAAVRQKKWDEMINHSVNRVM